MTNIPVKAAPAPEKKSGRPDRVVPAVLLLLACGALFFFMRNSPWKNEVQPETGDTAVSDENSFTSEGVLYGLDKMTSLRFLPEADKRRVPPLLSSPEDKVAYAAATLIGAWARAENNEELSRLWFETLLETASSGRPVVRRQAALEAGFVAALGFPVRPYLEKIRRASAGLAEQKEADLKGAGFFLSSMAGLEDLSGRMQEALLHDPSSSTRLYAACSLSRLGRKAGHDYLSLAATGKDPDSRREALSCLSYSLSPDAESLLLSASRRSFDPASAEAAKRGLLLRKQLAIIKK